ncbi:hypothetical protein ACFQWA_09225 [Streptomyces thermogriseus]|uniref:hypothetical protein n=1 Tax=Streptomyces thermogriseus TaxID=75292 RepID=UPI0036150968
MIKPEQIPQFTGDLDQLERDCAALKKDAGQVRGAGQAVHTRFQGLSAYYRAPEAEQLFATTEPVKRRADDFAGDLEKVAAALSSYASEVRPLVKKLKELKARAVTFVESVKDDDEWQYDGDKVEEHNALRDEITRTVAAFWAAERTCHNKITALWGGTQMVAGDGSGKSNHYGFTAADMAQAKLPWGDPVEEKHHWYEVGHWVKSFVWDGLIVDGVWGTIRGLGTLIGVDGWEAAGQAWKGLAQLATGLVLTAVPVVGAAFWTLPDDKLPSWIRDSRTAMKETGKALVAWDEWGKNPARAAGAVTFNVLTTVFTGGAGGAAAGAGKAGAVAKALSVAGKAGRAIDPMTYIAKGAGAGLSKIGDIAKSLKNIGNINIPKLPDTAFALPEGALALPNGTIRLPEGATLPAGAAKLPDGTVKLPDTTTVLPPGTVKLPTAEGAPARYFDPDGNILDEHGKVVSDVLDGPGDIVDQPKLDTPPAGADVPRVESPVKEPALAGAGTHTAEQAGRHIRLGDGLDADLGDTGRLGNDLNNPVSHVENPSGIADNTVGGMADNLPTNSVDNATPVTGTGDNLPGNSGNQVPSNNTNNVSNVDNAVSNTSDTTLRSDGLNRGPTGGHDLPSTSTDTLSRTDGPTGSGLDDLGRTGDEAAGAGDEVIQTGDEVVKTGDEVVKAEDKTPPKSPEDDEPLLIRQDDDFSATHNKFGLRKSHFDPDVGIIPANPEGKITPLEHVLGGANPAAKESSQFTSFAPKDGTGKVYGAQEISIDYKRLQADIESGKVQGVEILRPEQIQRSISEEINKVAGKEVEVPASLKASDTDAVTQFVKSLELSKSKTNKVHRRVMALLNTRRDGEWLISGIVPKEYVTGPYPTTKKP